MEDTAELLALLNTYLYLDYQNEELNSGSIAEALEVMKEIKKFQPGEDLYEEYTLLVQAVEKREGFGEIVLSNQSYVMGYAKESNEKIGLDDDPTRDFLSACTFTDPESGEAYVVYRGTDAGRWTDNGLGMVDASTNAQETALAYFDEVATQFTPEDTVFVTGHSKGGNNAQFVMLFSENNGLIDTCVSMDGEGFSQAALDRLEEKYPGGYDHLLERMYGVHGENDPVNHFGFAVIPKENTFYVRTEVEPLNFAGFHDIKYYFARLDAEGNTSYVPEMNTLGVDRGPVSDYFAVVSRQIMSLKPMELERSGRVIMTCLEKAFSEGGAYIPEGSSQAEVDRLLMNLRDVISTVANGAPEVLHSLYVTKEGLALQNYYAKAVFDAFGGGILGGAAEVALRGLLGVVRPLSDWITWGFAGLEFGAWVGDQAERFLKYMGVGVTGGFVPGKGPGFSEEMKAPVRLKKLPVWKGEEKPGQGVEFSIDVELAGRQLESLRGLEKEFHGILEEVRDIMAVLVPNPIVDGMLRQQERELREGVELLHELADTLECVIGIYQRTEMSVIAYAKQ